LLRNAKFVIYISRFVKVAIAEMTPEPACQPVFKRQNKMKSVAGSSLKASRLRTVLTL